MWRSAAWFSSRQARAFVISMACSLVRIRDGCDTTVLPSGISVCTTAPAPILTPLPMRMPPTTTAPAPMKQLSPMVGRLLADFTDGDVLVNPAIGAQNGVAGDVHAVETVGEGGLAGDFGTCAQVPAVAPRRAIQEKGSQRPEKTCLGRAAATGRAARATGDRLLWTSPPGFAEGAWSHLQVVTIQPPQLSLDRWL